jgi:hypothetical protein
MASTPVILLAKRSGNAADRPDTATIQAGEPALSFGGAEPGLYFKDSAGAIRKVGPTFYGSNAPNSSPVGSTGNSVGEMWVDSSASSYYLKVWTGSTWQKVGAGFSDLAATANVTIASGAIVANSAVVASGIAVVTTLPTASTGSLVYLNVAPSGLYVSANGGWILT